MNNIKIAKKETEDGHGAELWFDYQISINVERTESRPALPVIQF